MECLIGTNGVCVCVRERERETEREEGKGRERESRDSVLSACFDDGNNFMSGMTKYYDGFHSL